MANMFILTLMEEGWEAFRNDVTFLERKVSETEHLGVAEHYLICYRAVVWGVGAQFFTFEKIIII